MSNSRTARLTKTASMRLVYLNKISDIPKCRLIEKALKNYIPMEKDE